MKTLSDAAVRSPRFAILLPVLIALTVATLVAVPTLTGKFTNIIPSLKVDTDPENMLVYDDPVRVVHREQKEKFTVYDLMVIGVVNETHENGVFNAGTLSDLYDLSEYAQSLQWQDKDGNTAGVISVDVISPSNVDNIEQGGPGTVKFDWLMPAPPPTDEEALLIKEKALNQPMLNGSLVSENGRAIALYIPLTSKDVSYEVANLLKERIATYGGRDEFHITGMATAQDVFGVEMFQQMATATPLAMALIISLLWYFFRNVTLILSPIIVAMLSVMTAMSLMIITGNAIHLMTSMIPIFIMPIAVLDGIHILSEFHDNYPKYKDRKLTLKHVMRELSKPMLLTTVTTSVGFAALNLIPLPPLQVFGSFVSIGVIIAWFLTVTFIPAYIRLMPEHKFSKLISDNPSTANTNRRGRVLPEIGAYSLRKAKPIILFAIIL
ncbi:MAG: MMPL family transporter, partial [Gammaproteobacteria bacterium]|nr:MMPL family transporter [Gammaproteobacteria bacterium]